MTKITIEVDGAAAVQTQAPVSPASPVAPSATTLPSTANINGGGAPYADASHDGPFPFSSAPSAAQQPSFSPEGAISAGSAPGHLMMDLPKGGAQ